MKTFRNTVIALGSVGLATAASASISFNVAAGVLTDDLGTQMGDGVIVLVADTASDGFAVPSAAGGFAPGADDYVIAQWNFSEGGDVPGEFYGAYVASWNPSWVEGAPLALFWFPGLADDSATPTAGAKFGAYSGSALGVSVTGENWTLPANGTHGYSIQFFSEGSILSQNTFASEYVAQASLEEGTAPLDLVAETPIPAKTSATSNTVSWTAGGAASSYTIQRRAAGTTAWTTLDYVSGATNSFIDTELSPGTTYEYRVIAENGFSSFVNTSSEQLFAERSQFRGVAIRANNVVADAKTHSFGGVILASGGVDAASTRRLHMQAYGNDTENAAGNQNGIFLTDPTMALFDQFVVNWTLSNDDYLATPSADDVLEMEALSAMNPKRGNILNASADNRDAGLLLDAQADPADAASPRGYAFQLSPYVPADPANPKANYAGAAQDAEAVVSIYDAEDIDGSKDDIRIKRLAARGHVSDTSFFGMIGGLAIEGNVPKKVLIVGKGPLLETDQPDLTGLALTDPRFLLRLGGTLDVIASNDDWGSPSQSSDPGVVNVETDVGVISQALLDAGYTNMDTHPKDCVMLVDLAPGTYTVELVGFSGGAREEGLAFLEMEEIE